MRQSPEMSRIQYNMQSGSLSSEGFLGTDTRNLADILHEDHATVESLGISHQEIAKKMDYFTQKGLIELGRPVLVDEIFEVTVEDHKGALPCPFSDNFNAKKQNTKVVNLKKNKSLTWTDLNTHMIGAHGFYEGKGATYRVDPSEIFELLW
jgi:hypothetical protein